MRVNPDPLSETAPGLDAGIPAPPEKSPEERFGYLEGLVSHVFGKYHSGEVAAYNATLAEEAAAANT
jgi:hypothetical protein